MSVNLAVIGAGSMVGSQACDQFEQAGCQLTKGDLAGENPIDITDKSSVRNFFSGHEFDWAILFSAYTDVDGAQKQRNDKNGPCWKINVDGVKNIVDAASDNNRKLVFISTDFIFDGASGPYKEQDPPGPNLDKVGWYGATKIEGEKIIMENLKEGDWLILRISFPFSGKNVAKADFATRIISLYKSGNLYPMYSDQIITPTFIPDVAPAILAIITGAKHGIYHLASSKPTTPHEFATYLISKHEGREVKLKKSKLADQLKEPQATPRPLKGGLVVEKIAPLYKPTPWQEALDIALVKYFL